MELVDSCNCGNLSFSLRFSISDFIDPTLSTSSLDTILSQTPSSVHQFGNYTFIGPTHSTSSLNTIIAQTPPSVHLVWILYFHRQHPSSLDTVLSQTHSDISSLKTILLQIPFLTSSLDTILLQTPRGFFINLFF